MAAHCLQLPRQHRDHHRRCCSTQARMHVHRPVPAVVMQRLQRWTQAGVGTQRCSTMLQSPFRWAHHCHRRRRRRRRRLRRQPQRRLQPAPRLASYHVYGHWVRRRRRRRGRYRSHHRQGCRWRGDHCQLVSTNAHDNHHAVTTQRACIDTPSTTLPHCTPLLSRVMIEASTARTRQDTPFPRHSSARAASQEQMTGSLKLTTPPPAAGPTAVARRPCDAIHTYNIHAVVGGGLLRRWLQQLLLFGQPAQVSALVHRDLLLLGCRVGAVAARVRLLACVLQQQQHTRHHNSTRIAFTHYTIRDGLCKELETPCGRGMQWTRNRRNTDNNSHAHHAGDFTDHATPPQPPPHVIAITHDRNSQHDRRRNADHVPVARARRHWRTPGTSNRKSGSSTPSHAPSPTPPGRG